MWSITVDNYNLLRLILGLNFIILAFVATHWSVSGLFIGLAIAVLGKLGIDQLLEWYRNNEDE